MIQQMKQGWESLLFYTSWWRVCGDAGANRASQAVTKPSGFIQPPDAPSSRLKPRLAREVADQRGVEVISTSVKHHFGPHGARLPSIVVWKCRGSMTCGYDPSMPMTQTGRLSARFSL